MSNQGYYQGGPQYPQQSYGGGYPQQGGYGGPPPQGYYNGPPQGGMQYQQGPQGYTQGNQVVVREKKDRGCLGACLAALCCCFVCEEGCECCADCCECFADCC